MKDPYVELGLKPGATEAEVKKAYRKMAAKHHPDKGGKEEDFKRIKEAYERITEPEKFAHERQHSGGHRQYWGGSHEDIMEEMLRQHGFRASAGGPFGGFNIKVPKQVFVAITLEEAFSGTTAKITIPGTTEQFEMQLQPGLQSGMQFQAQVNLASGKTEMLVVTVNIKEHSIYKLDGIDLRADVKLPLLDFYTGGSVALMDLSGATYSLKVPKGFQPGGTLRLKEKGYVMNGKRGNIYVTINVKLPELTEEQVQKLKEIL